MRALTVIFLCCFLFACDHRPNAEVAAVGLFSAQESEMEKSESSTFYPVKQVRNADVPSERKLIKTAFINISVKNAANTQLQLQKICNEFNAYISSETQANYGERIEYSQVIRIPAGNFDAFVKKTADLGKEVNNKSIETSDVTEEFVDIQARLKTKRELESRYREILKQAKTVSDMLSIEAQLNNVRGEIESTEGRLNYLNGAVSYSTLTLTFYESIGAESEFGSKTMAAFSNGWDMLLAFIIGMVHLWPFLLLAAGLVYAVYYRARHRSREVSET